MFESLTNRYYSLVSIGKRGVEKMEIMIHKQETRQAGNQISGYVEDLQQDIHKFEYLMESINTVWEGADALKYINLMKEKYTPQLEQLKDTLKEYGEYLTKVPDAYDILDETFSSRKINV